MKCDSWQIPSRPVSRNFNSDHNISATDWENWTIFWCFEHEQNYKELRGPAFAGEASGKIFRPSWGGPVKVDCSLSNATKLFVKTVGLDWAGFNVSTNTVYYTVLVETLNPAQYNPTALTDNFVAFDNEQGSCHTHNSNVPRVTMCHCRRYQNSEMIN